jgi:methylmalonyl-CoA mutase
MNDQAGPKQRWHELARQEAHSPVLPLTSPAGVVYQPVYVPGEVQSEASVPGEFPFARGSRASMYRGRPWTLRQYAGFSTAEESNAFFRECLSRGQRGLSVAFDLPTHRGYDSDHERARGDVGKAGVAIDSVEDMVLLFEGIPLDQVSVSMTMNGAVLPVMAAYIVAAEEQGKSLQTLRGTIQNDILKEFLVRNTFIYPPRESMRVVADVIAYCSEHLPQFNPISISGYHMQEAGARADLELGLTLANGLAYIQAALDRGLGVDEFAPRLSFFFGIGMDLFLEVAKLRAARKLWAELVNERFAPKQAQSTRLRMHCQTSGVSLTAQQPLNNVVRTTIEALAAVLGGTQSLHTNAYDEALALPTRDSARVARNTQLIIQEETDIPHTVDPLGGSYLVEDLTCQLVDRAREVVREIDAHGGMISAIEAGIPQQRIGLAAAGRQLEIDEGRQRLVGVNCYVEPDVEALPIRTVDAREVLKTQLERLARLRAQRDNAQVRARLLRLQEAARASDDNLLAHCVTCMRARATLGEVSAALESVWSRYQPRAQTVYGVFSAEMGQNEEWQALGRRIAAFEKQWGRRPRILVAKIGQDGHDRGAKVIASGFADAGFDVDLGPLFQTPREVAQAAVDSDVHVVGISTQAGGHQLLVPELMKELAACAREDVVVVCGGIIPEPDHAALRASGVKDIFEPGTSVVECARRVMDVLEAVGAGSEGDSP